MSGKRFFLASLAVITIGPHLTGTAMWHQAGDVKDEMRSILTGGSRSRIYCPQVPLDRLLTACVIAGDPSRLARFWAELLGRQITQDALDLLVPGENAEVGLRFVPGGISRTGPNRLHLHVASETSRHQQMTVDHALRLGAQHLDVGQSEDDKHVVLADPEGNEFCVIEPENSFLAGCGLLAELACDGSRAVGVFWSGVLQWPLVWDQDDETAIQSPEGGTKIAWGGASTRGSDADRTALELTLVGGDATGQVDRLISLGSTELTATADGVRFLADPDGVAFRLLIT